MNCLIKRILRSSYSTISTSNIHPGCIIQNYSSTNSKEVLKIPETKTNELHTKGINSSGDTNTYIPNDSNATEISTNPKKSKKKKRLPIIIPKSSLKDLQRSDNFTSYIVDTDGIYGVCMSNLYNIKYCESMPFSIKDRHAAGVIQSVDKLYKFMDNFPKDANYAVIERMHYKRLDMRHHVQFVQGIVASRYHPKFTSNFEVGKCFQMSRIYVGNHFNLNINSNRISGMECLKTILKNEHCNGSEINYTSDCIQCFEDDTFMVKSKRIPSAGKVIFLNNCYTYVGI